MHSFRALLVCCLFTLCYGTNFGGWKGTCKPHNVKPTIGILTQRLNRDGYPKDTLYIAASYVKFVEQMGAQAVPIFTDRSWFPSYSDYQAYLSRHLSGVIFPGGSVSIEHSYYAESAQFWYNHTIDLYDNKGEIFPILGICLGFEELMDLAAGESVMSKTDSSNYLIPLNLTSYGREVSRLFRLAPDWLLHIFTHNDVTANFHHYSLLASTYETNLNLNNVFEVVATNLDRNGLEFVSAVEGVNYPILGFQFHPEKNMYEWGSNLDLAHNLYGVTASTYLANVFGELTRQSCNTFPDPALQRMVIYNYNATYTQDVSSSFTQQYIFTNPNGDNY